MKSLVESIWENPKAQLLENHYKFVKKIIKNEYPKTVETISDETLEGIIYDVVYLDRFLRRKRQGNQEKLKDKLVKSFLGELNA